MKRKDCNNTGHRPWVALIAIAIAADASTASGGQSVRIWPTAVVLDHKVTLRDTCDLTQLDPSVRDAVGSTVIVQAPPPGGSTVIDARTIQAALRQAGVNLATVVVTGATQCALTRPKSAAPKPEPTTADDGRTLQTVVEEAFQQRARAYGARVELQFGRSSPHVLTLSEPTFQFDVKVRSGQWIGQMIRVDVDVTRDGVAQPPVHLVVAATLHRRVVVARRAINLKAPIRRDDVQIVERAYTKLDHPGLDNPAAVVGQRARRFIPAGQTIKMTDLERVPLVIRGQLVDVISVAGGIRVRSVAKAASAGSLGDIVELRVGGPRGERLTGVVTGERRVVVGGPTLQHTRDDHSVAMGGYDAP